MQSWFVALLYHTESQYTFYGPFYIIKYLVNTILYENAWSSSTVALRWFNSCPG